MCQESSDHYDSEPFNREEGDDSQHLESAPYDNDGSSHNDESSGEVQSDIAEINISKETLNIVSNSKSNRYFWQEYNCYRKNEPYGRLRGIV